MRSGKKLISAIIVIVVLLLLAGAAFAYVYVATDIFRTDKEMFFKYFTQITSDENAFLDKRIGIFTEKKKELSYDNSGEIAFDVELPDEIKDLAEDKLEKINDLVISYSGKVDSSKQKVEQNIKVDYGNNVILPINYKQDGNAIGLQTNELSKKYIAVKNENLKELASNLGFDGFVEIPDKLEIPEEVKNVGITDEEVEQLKQIYMPILQENLLDENFSSTKTEQNESFTLDLKNEQIKNIIIKMLETSKQNTLIIDKFNEIMLEQNAEAEKIEVSAIDDLIKEINSEEISKNIPNLKLTLVQSNKLLKRIIIQLNESIITIEKTNETDNVSYNFNCQLDVNQFIGDSSDLLEEDSEENTEIVQASIFFNVQYKGLNTLAKVDENYNFGFDISKDQENLRYEYQILNSTEFMSDLNIADLNKDNAVFLNDYNEEQIQPFLTQVGTRIVAINKKQMEKLGLKEDENPILYINPITMLGLMVFDMANDTITNVDFSSMEVSAFNDKFLPYEGEGERSTNVEALLQTVVISNMQNLSEGLNPMEDDKFVTVNGNAGIVVNAEDKKRPTNVDTSKLYNIKLEYDEETGFVSNIVIDEQ